MSIQEGATTSQWLSSPLLLNVRKRRLSKLFPQSAQLSPALSPQSLQRHASAQPHVWLHCLHRGQTRPSICTGGPMWVCFESKVRADPSHFWSLARSHLRAVTISALGAPPWFPTQSIPQQMGVSLAHQHPTSGLAS